MSEEKAGSYKGLTEARKRANKKYNDRFVEIKVRVTPEERSIIKDHADAMGESATAFINRAIDEAMERDLKSNRQIIMRSDKKLPQPFASWSNSL